MKYLPALGMVVLGVVMWICDLRYGASFLFGGAFNDAWSQFEERSWRR